MAGSNNTNNFQSINTFTKGMNLDTTIPLVSNDSYIYGENVRVIVDDISNTGSLHAVEGLTNLTENGLKYKYYEYNKIYDKVDELYADFSISKFKIIGIGVIRDYVCVFTRDVNEPTYNYIFRLLIKNNIPELTMLVSGEFNIGGEDQNQISITTKWEDFDNIKIYWADGVNSLRTINISEENDLSNFDKSPNFFDNTITIGTSKPIFVSFISGNLKAGMIQYAYQMFNVNGAETSISPLSDLIHLTKSNAFDVNYQGSGPDTNTGKSCKIKFEITDERFNRCKVYRIHYNNAEELPKVYVISEFNVSLTSEDGINFQYFSDSGAISDEITYEEFISSNPYFFIPKVLESKDNRLFAANIIEDTWSLPGPTEDGWYDTRAFRFANVGTNGVHSKIEALNNDTKIIKKTDLDSLPIDQWLTFIPHDHDCINPVNTNFDDTLDRGQTSYEWYYDGSLPFKHKGGNGRNVSFKIVHTKFGEDWYEKFTGNRGNFLAKKLEYDGHSKLVKIKNDGEHEDNNIGVKYNINDVGEVEYDNNDYYIESPVDFKSLGTLNYSNAYLDAKYRSYQRDEIYRFGVVFYSKRGQTSPVSWIADIRMPSMSEKDHRLFDQWERIKVAKSTNESNVYQIVTYPMGLQFEFRNLPEEVHQIEIVRCERTRADRRILTQGLISRTATGAGNSYFEGGVTRPLPCLTYTDSFRQWLYAGTTSGSTSDADKMIYVNNNPFDYSAALERGKTSGLFTFLSPEISYFTDQVSDFTNRITGYNILYGLSSPTQLSNIFDGNIDGGNYNAVKYVRDMMVHTYNSQVWFNGETINPGSGSLNIRYFMDGSSNKFNRGIKNISMSGVSGIGSSESSHPELKSKWVAKMYHPFTTYTNNNDLKQILNPIISSNISDIEYASPLEYTQYEQIKEGGNAVTVSNSRYQNWVFDKSVQPTFNNGNSSKIKHGAFAPCFVFKDTSIFDKLPFITKLGNSYNNYFSMYGFSIPPTTSTGSDIGLDTIDDKAECYSINSTFLVNMCQNSNFYGGLDYNSRLNSIYIPTQSLITIGDDTRADMTVFSGDTYIGISEIMTQHWYYLESDPIPADRDTWEKRGEKCQITVYFPCESTINHNMVHGSQFFRYANDNKDSNSVWHGSGGNFPHEMQAKGGFVSVETGWVQPNDMYGYNSVYSVQPMAATFIPKGAYTEDNKNYDYRVLYSEMKTNDEIVDNWLKFKVANYRDVDTRFGSINNMKLFNNYLYYWQDDAFGVLSVNTRSLIQDNNIGQLVLGKGDVLERYDHISTSNGSKKDVINNIAITPSTMFWYDHDRGEILAFSDQLNPISKMKGVQSFFNKNKQNITDDIITLYNKKYTEVNFMFNMVDETYNHLIYNEQIGGFTSFYTFDPDWFIDLRDEYYTFKNNNIHKLNSSSYNKFYNDIDNTKLTNLVNENQTYTKVFDNIETTGNVELNDSFYAEYKTRTQDSLRITKDDVKLKEDNYRFVVPRSTNVITTESELFPNYNNRLRGKYLISTYNFKPLNNDLDIPYIKTSYRISMI